jgi:glutathione S-transferase
MKGPRFDVDFLGQTAVPLVFWNTGSCPFAQRAWIALEEKQVPYEFRKVDLSAKPSDFVAAYRSVNSNPNAKPKVPVVRTADNYTMIESDVVAEYLSERFPDRGSRLMPTLPEQKARVRLLAAVFDQTIGSSGFAFLRASGREELTKERNVLLSHLQALNTFLERHGSGHGPFLYGANFSLAEVHTAPFVQRLLVLLPRLSNLNVLDLCRKLGLYRLHTWLEAVATRPSVMTTGIGEDDLVESYRRMLANSAH